MEPRKKQPTKKTSLSREKRQYVSRFRLLGVKASAAIMALGLAIGLVFFARPSTSVVEKRSLTEFPHFSASSFLSGEFFTDLSLWYADTYPLRESLVAANQSIQKLYGVQPKIQLVGGNISADSIPVQDEEENTPEEKPNTPAEEVREEVDAPEALPMQEAVQQQLMNGVVLYDGAGYNLYYFVEENVNTYLSAVNSLARSLEGQAELYAVIIPNSSSILLPPEELEQLGGSDQAQTIDYFFSHMDSSIHTVNCFDALSKHADEYIFFRSDHHWTQLGAYYAYVAFCEKRGIEPLSKAEFDSWETLTFEPFLGTFYAETLNPDMAANPDYVEAHIPADTNEVSYWIDNNFVEQDTGNIITDVSDWGDNTGYYCFTIGDEPLIRIDNPKLNDGSNVLILKDSYGNSFIPQLVHNYQTVWVIDYRYSSTSIVDFVRENNISEVIIENNIAIATAPNVGIALLDQVEGDTNSQL